MRIFALFAVLICSILVGSSPAWAKSQRGVWRTTSEPAMVAHITKNTIRIDWVNDDGTRDLYWKGSWHTVRKNGAKVTSFGDTETMDKAIFASTLDEKVFTYSNGQLVFTFAIMGAHKKLRLQKKS